MESNQRAPAERAGTIRAKPEEVFDGSRVVTGRTSYPCDACSEDLVAGDDVVVHITQHRESDAWTRAGVYHRHETDDVDFPAADDTTEVLVAGRFAHLTDPQAGKLHLSLIATETLRRATPEGRA